MRAFAFSIAAAALAAAPAAAREGQAEKAQEAPAAAETADSKDASAEPRKICKRIESSARRTQAKKFCLTAEQWKKLQAD